LPDPINVFLGQFPFVNSDLIELPKEIATAIVASIIIGSAHKDVTREIRPTRTGPGRGRINQLSIEPNPMLVGVADRERDEIPLIRAVL
jgi:hypothetical protein